MPFLIEKKTVEENAALCRTLGLDFLQLNMSFPVCGSKRLNGQYLRQIRDEYGIGLTIHLDEMLSVCAYEPEVRRVNTELAVHAIRSAKEAGCPVVNMHWQRGVYITLPERIVYMDEVYRKEYLECTKAFRSACEDAAGGMVRVCIENTGGWLPCQQEAIEQLLESNCFGLTLDIGHEAATGGIDSAFYEKHSDRLWHMHAHDVQGKHDHLAFGDGELNLAAKLLQAHRAGARALLQIKTVEALGRTVQWVHAHRREITELHSCV